MPGVLILALSAVVASGRATELPAPAQVHLFFLGCTEGKGLLRVIARHPREVRVHSLGRQVPDGTLIVSQKVDQEGRPRILRTWRLREVEPGKFAGTLSTALGPVTGQAVGEGLHLSFWMKGGLHVDQRLSYASRGESLNNVMTVRKLGVVVGRIRETITKKEDASCD